MLRQPVLHAQLPHAGKQRPHISECPLHTASTFSHILGSGKDVRVVALTSLTAVCIQRQAIVCPQPHTQYLLLRPRWLTSSTSGNVNGGRVGEPGSCPPSVKAPWMVPLCASHTPLSELALETTGGTALRSKISLPEVRPHCFSFSAPPHHPAPSTASQRPSCRLMSVHGLRCSGVVKPQLQLPCTALPDSRTLLLPCTPSEVFKSYIRPPCTALLVHADHMLCACLWNEPSVGPRWMDEM